MTSHNTRTIPQWATVAQRRHVVLAWERSEAWSYARSACGWLLTLSVYDRAPDAPPGPVCTVLYPDFTAVVVPVDAMLAR